MNSKSLTIDEQEQETVRTYDMYADAWMKEHADRKAAGYEVLVQKLQEFLPNGSLIEVGAGGGSDGALLAHAGYDYFGTDVSMGMVSAARKVYPDLTFEQRSVYDLAKLGREFDGFWSAATLLHVPRVRIDEALQNITAVLKPGAAGFISMKAGDRDEFEQREQNGRSENRLFVYWLKDEFEAVLKRNGFSVLWYDYQPLSARTNWHRFIIRKG